MLSPSLLERSSSVRENARLAALEYSILEERPAVANQCIEDGVDVNAITPFSGVKPLELALEMRDVGIMQLLLDGGADTEGENAQGSTVLISASRYGYLECVKLLVDYGASLYARGVDRKTCVHAALEQNRHSVVTYLLRQDAYVRSLRTTDALCLLQHLILTDDAASISRLRHCEVDLNATCPDGFVLILFALKHLKSEALKGLLQAGADPNIHDMNGYFALHEAVRQNNIDAARYLIKHGANSAMKNKGSLTPVALAILGKQLPMLRMMVDCSVDIEQNLGCGTTPLIAACVKGFRDGVKLLVERGANLKACTTDGETCLLVALRSEHNSVADYLLDQDACNVNGIGIDGLSALHHAVRLNNEVLMYKLIKKQANVNVQNQDGEVPVFTAAKKNALNLLRMLLEVGADPNIDTKLGDFALHEAVKKGNVEAVKLLLKHGADRTRKNMRGITPVGVARALVPSPKDIIHCLKTAYKNTDVFHAIDEPDEDNKKISVAQLEDALCCCPITFEIMKDPVLAMDGHTYEREAIEEWLREKRESPVTRQPLTSSILIPNLSIKNLIDRFAAMDSNA